MHSKGDVKLIFDMSKEGRYVNRIKRYDISDDEVSSYFPDNIRSEKKVGIPEVSELGVVRHYTRLSHRNFGIDMGFYPLGSCTMKYNPKVNEEVALLSGFTNVHPHFPEENYQGMLKLMYELEADLSEITGMKGISLQPAAGAHGEFASLLILRAYLKDNGLDSKDIIIVPDQAHGTNPASASMAGFAVKVVKSDENGLVTADEVNKVMDKFGDRVAGIMLTNPNTLGKFEKHILDVAKIIHDVKGLLYYDGANMNALLGLVRPGDMGFDLVHLNLHKTFSTPHGGGGPGSGPIGVAEHLIKYLPNPKIVYKNDKYSIDKYEKSIGKIKTFFGNVLVMVKAYAYIKQLGSEGLKRVGEHSVLNANYLQERLKDFYNIPYYGRCMHEFVVSATKQKEKGVSAMDIAKKLLENGFHAPTVYFPLIVPESMMIEPTETESKETLDAFCDLMIEFAKEIDKDPEKFKELSDYLPIKHPDETNAARNPILKHEE